MSVQAMTWVLEEAPDLKPNLVSVLMGLANHADRSGAGSYPAQSTLAKYARKTDRAVRNDLAQLEVDGLIRRGDQRLAAHLPADERPIVWDLAVERKRAAEPPEGPEVQFRANRRRGRKHSSAPSARGAGSTVPPGSLVPRDRKPTSGGDRKPTSDEPSFEPSLNHSPLPPDDPPTSAAAGPRDEGEESLPEDPQEPAPVAASPLDALIAEIRARRPEWTADAVRRVLAEPRVQERPAPIVAAALRLVAADPRSTSPGRLRADGPWWAEAAAAVRRRTQAAAGPPGGAVVRQIAERAARAAAASDAETIAAQRAAARAEAVAAAESARRARRRTA